MTNDTAVSCAKTAETIEICFGCGLEEPCIRWGLDPHAMEQFLGERTCLCVPDNTAASCAKMAKPICKNG